MPCWETDLFRRAVHTIVVLALACAVAVADEVDDVVARARGLQASGDSAGAIALLVGLEKRYPDDLRPKPLLAFLVTETEGGLVRAAELLQAYLDRYPRDEWCAGHLYIVADRALSEGRPEVARDCAATLRRLDPSNKEYRFLWAEAAYRMGDGEAARHACDLLIQDFPSFEQPYWLKARTLADVGRFDDEIEVWRDLLREQPGNVAARLRMGWAQRRLRDFGSAEESYRAARDIAGSDTDLAKAADFGLRAVVRERALGARLREHRSFLDTLLAAAAVAWLTIVCILFFMSRRRPSMA